MGRSPAQFLLGENAGGRDVQAEEGADPAGVGSCVLGCDGGDRDIELAADDLGDVAGCDPFLAYGVHDGTGRGMGDRGL